MAQGEGAEAPVGPKHLEERGHPLGACEGGGGLRGGCRGRVGDQMSGAKEKKENAKYRERE